MGSVQVWPTQSLLERADATGIFSALIGAVEAAGLADLINDQSQPVTVFAPTDGAFALVDPAVLEHLLAPENLAELVSIISYHVAAGTIPIPTPSPRPSLSPSPSPSPSSAYLGQFAKHELIEQGSVTTLAGTDLIITVPTGTSDTMVNDAKLTNADIFALGGVIHGIGKVLMPPSVVPGDNNIMDVLQASPLQFGILANAIELSGFGDQLRAAGPMT